MILYVTDPVQCASADSSCTNTAHNSVNNELNVSGEEVGKPDCS